MKCENILNTVDDFIESIPKDFYEIINEVFNEEDYPIKRCARCLNFFSFSNFGYINTRNDFDCYCTDCRNNIAAESSKSFVKYIDFKDKLTIEELPISDEFGNLLVKCKFCKDYFIPTRNQIHIRLAALDGGSGEGSIYCSDECKDKCPVYNKSSNESTTVYQRDPNYIKQANEISLEKAGYSCEICGGRNNLQVHHIKPSKTYPIEMYDIDNLVVLCVPCHYKYGHDKEDNDCSLGSLRNACIK